MKPENRLTSPRDFKRVFRDGARATCGSVVCVATHGARAGPARIGVVAGPALGRAVVRNRARRRAREAVRGMLGELRPGAEAVLILRADAAGKSFQDLRGDLAAALNRAGAVAC